MKKQLLAGLLILSFMTAVLPAHAEKADTATTEESGFVKVYLECPEAEKLQRDSYPEYARLLMRYADDKTPIAMSMPYDGRIWATIPAENAKRPLEYFVSEEMTFTDEPSDEEYSDDSYYFYIMGQLSARGVIAGNEKGEARPLDNVTRAEAVAMTMRFLGVDNMPDTNSGFSDVAEDAWYAAAVTKARELGVVAGDDATHFSPMRNVSREEAIALVARCLWISGMQQEKKVTREELLEEAEFADGEEIADWALSAYNTLKNDGAVDYLEAEYDENGEAIYRAMPKKAATRFFTANVILNACDRFQVYPSKEAISFGFDKAMPRIDGSTSTYPFTEAVYYNLFSNGYYASQKPEKHSKSHASYERLINGEVDLIFASVYPASDILALAEENGVELELVPIAYDAMIFFTNMDNPIKGLTKKQISDIYVNNNYSNWKDLGGETANLYPYCRNNDSGSHAQMERYFLNGNEINEKIRMENTSDAMANILTDVMGSQTDNPRGYGLGYSIYYYFQNMDLIYDTNTYLKLLEINGVYPDDETIASGEYPLSNNTYAVMRKDEPEDSPARKMAEFMLTEKGQLCVEQAGFGPITPAHPKEMTVRKNTASFTLYANDEQTPIIRAGIEYPQVSKKGRSFADKMNKRFVEIYEAFDEQVRSSRDSIADYYEETKESEEEEDGYFPFENYLGYYVTRNTGGIFSITFTESFYTGGAHPYGDGISITYDTKTGQELKLSDVLKKSQEETNQFVIDKFNEKYSDYELWDLEEEAPDVSFCINDDYLVIYFQQYQIGPYAMGFPEVEIPLDEIQ